ncbi:MAG: Nramp family divalent metal transporter [Eubacteriales bacterium]
MPSKAIKAIKKNKLWRNILLFMAILGPGIVTGSVDNDVGGITTYSVAGAIFGYKLIWTLIPAFIVLFVTQEMNTRMGIVTGKGLADLIRENMGVKVTFVIFVLLLITNILNTMTEFSGVAGSMDVFHVSKYISVPIVAVVVWILVVKGSYRIAERVFLLFSFCLLVYIFAALMGKPDWTAIGQSVIKPDVETNFVYISTVIGLIGTTIAPWMQFYIQSAVIEKKLKVKDLKFSVLDVFIGCVATVVVAFFIIVACAATLNKSGTVITTAGDAAAALAPLAGAFASQVFAFGLFIASVFASVILPVATAFFVCEAFGFEAGIDKKWSEAPQFYWLYTAIIAISAGIILIPNAPLIQISLWSQRINGILLPVVLVCMVIIINKKEVMGKYVNKPISNIISWATIVILLGLTVTLVVSLFQ